MDGMRVEPQVARLFSHFLHGKHSIGEQLFPGALGFKRALVEAANRSRAHQGVLTGVSGGKPGPDCDEGLKVPIYLRLFRAHCPTTFSICALLPFD
ncbi:MAG: hypothetical protein WDN04_15700 [Rhodospirillales bacterium]